MVRMLNLNRYLCIVIALLNIGLLRGQQQSSLLQDAAVLCRPGFIEEQSQPLAWSFNAEYLSKYYPKAYVIRSYFFEKMTATQVAQALDSIVAVLAESPWFYFVDAPEKINVALYWEHIVDQCSLLSDFLKKARVFKSSGIVFLPTKLDGDDLGGHFSSFLVDRQSHEYQQSDPLLQVWRLNGVMCAYNFYALCFDYVIKLFNEGFLLNDFKQVQRYYFELEFLAARLCNSYYEAPYQEAMKNAKELITLYKTNYMTSDVAYATGTSYVH